MNRSVIILVVSGFYTATAIFAQQAPAPAPAPSTQPTTKPADLPPGQLLDQMLKPQATAPRPLTPVMDAPTIDKTTGAAAIAPGAPQMNLMREGSFLVDRIGRLTKSAEGTQYEFTFDSDGKTMQDPPVIILPNLKLTAMQNAVTGASRDLRFRITGIVTEYSGRNYVLLEKVVVVPDSMQQF